MGEPPSALEGIWEAKNAGAYDDDKDIGWIKDDSGVFFANGSDLGFLFSFGFDLNWVLISNCF